jgi:hypothetical protein
MILNRSQKRPFGWRSCTQSPNSIELLMEQGYLWNSNSFSHDLPFVWQNGKKKVSRAAAPTLRRRAHVRRPRFRQSQRHVGHLESDVRSVLRGVEPRADLLSVSISSVHFQPGWESENPVRHHRSHEVAQRCLVRYRSEVAHWWLEKGFSAEANAKFQK